jgi:hypothetical protein
MRHSSIATVRDHSPMMADTDKNRIMKTPAILVATSCLAVACGSSDNSTTSGTCTRTATGSLAISVTGLPGGLNADLRLVGANNVTNNATATSTMALPSGTYSVSAGIVADIDPIVRRAFSATVGAAQVTVCDGQTVALSVDYAMIPTSNKIWWGNENGSNASLGYASASLAASATTTPTVLASTAGMLPGAFDDHGDLWVLNGTAGSVAIERYTASELAAGGQVRPSLVISSDAFTGGVPGPASMAFDAKGNAWVGIVYSSKVVEFPAASLSATSTVAPAVEISNVTSPSALAFDSKGNLWVGTADSVVEYAAARLASSTSAAPDATISAMTPAPVIGPLGQPLGLAFTTEGDLWVNFDGTLAKLTEDQLSTGSITPAIQIQADVLALPSGIALDDSGGLWMAYSAGKFCKFGTSQLGASGVVAPEVVVTSDGIGSATSPAFFPAPPGLPLWSALDWQLP